MTQRKANIYLLVLLIWLAACTSEPKHQFDSTELGINMTLKGNFEVKDDRSENNVRYIKYQAGSDFLKIKIYDAMGSEKARGVMENKKFLIQNLYEDQPSPYPGRLSNKLGCPEELKPKLFDQEQETGNWMFAFQIKANERFVYGNCIAESNFYDSAYAFYYCKDTQKLFELKYFTPIAKPANDIVALVKSLNC